jgi:uncharacterized protein (DUF885 family)
MAELEDAALQQELVAALETMGAALDAFSSFLEDRRASATDDFALGAEKFSRALAHTQGIEIDLDRLQEVLQADLERNRAALEAAAAEIAPGKPITQVVAQVAGDKPPANKVLHVATEQVAQMRTFVVQHDIVTIPSQDTAQVVESPPFMRWNAAFLDSAGPFERERLPSFYYISPPDPTWPAAKRKDYIPGRTDLLFITIHEVWPGHFLHGLHVKNNPSRILRSLWNYATGEGWAHYTEEMMWAQGISDDPRVHVGQLLNALLRNVRALSAIGLHTRGMTVERSKKMFLEQAFQDEANAEQQAVRGTFDPMYLSYTLGKLVILKLRGDYEAERRARGETFELRAFHDAFLSHGSAPLPAVVASMLEEANGEIL